MSDTKHDSRIELTTSGIRVPAARSAAGARDTRSAIRVPRVSGQLPPAPDADAPSHKGKGPKGYVRNDVHLRHAIEEFLAADPTLDATEISVRVQDGVVTLSGSVPGRRSRYAAIAAAHAVAGPASVRDTLRVADDE